MTKNPILIALVLAAAGCSTPEPDPAAPNTELTDQELTTQPCASNADCKPADYCATPSGQCSSAGACTTRPRFCPTIILPVCGCDGGTYGNACDAARAGANVSHRKSIQEDCSDTVGKPAPVGPTCGGRVCPGGQICCNPSCGTCVPKGQLCTQQVCD